MTGEKDEQDDLERSFRTSLRCKSLAENGKCHVGMTVIVWTRQSSYVWVYKPHCMKIEHEQLINKYYSCTKAGRIKC